MSKSAKVAMLFGVVFFIIFPAKEIYSYKPPDPTLTYYGDADGDEYMTVLDIPALETQANVGLCLDFSTMQPNNDDQRWNTCDADGDGYCTVLDLPYLYKVSYGGIIDQSPFSAWQISNYNLPTSDNYAGEWIPFQLSVTADPGYGMGAIGRPGMIVKVTIVSEGSTTTGKLSGRSCTPDYWGDPDQLNAGDDQCAVGVSISDWVNHPADALTEDAADSMGLQVWGDGDGTLQLHVEVSEIASFLIPKLENDFYITFIGGYYIDIDCSLPGPNPVDELTAMECLGWNFSGGTPQRNAANDTCGGDISFDEFSRYYTYDFTPTESQGPGSCVAAVQIAENPNIKASDVIYINEVNAPPVWDTPPTDIVLNPNDYYEQDNGHAVDSDIPVQELSFSSGQTCSFPITVTGSGVGEADCHISFTAGSAPEICRLTIGVTDGSEIVEHNVSISVGMFPDDSIVEETSTWDINYGSNPPYDFYSVFFPTPTEGWAAGYDGIYHYENGAWHLNLKVTSDWMSINSLFFVSPTEGWAVGEVSGMSEGVILHYIDGKWHSVAPPCGSGPLNSVYFLSPSEGWAVGYDGLALHYSNGNWSQVPTPEIALYWWELNSVYFTSSSEGWAAGGGYVRTPSILYHGVILHYIDGVWEDVTPTLSGEIRLYSVYFTSSSEGWVGGVDWGTCPNRSILLHYSDGNWSRVTPPRNGGIKSLHFTSPSEGWAGGKWSSSPLRIRLMG